MVICRLLLAQHTVLWVDYVSSLHYDGDQLITRPYSKLKLFFLLLWSGIPKSLLQRSSAYIQMDQAVP